MHPNVENFIGCDSSYRAASIVLYGAPYDSTTSYRPGARFGPAAVAADKGLNVGLHQCSSTSRSISSRKAGR